MTKLTPEQIQSEVDRIMYVHRLAVDAFVENYAENMYDNPEMEDVSINDLEENAWDYLASLSPQDLLNELMPYIE